MTRMQAVKDYFARLILFVGDKPLWLVALFFGVFAPLWVFGQLAEELWEGKPFFFDVPVLHFIHSFASPTLDVWIGHLTRLGGATGMVPLSVAICVFLLVQRRARDARFFAVAAGGAALINLLAKACFGRARPALWPSPMPETDYSFPSGHAMASMAVAAAIMVMVWPTRWRWPLGIVAGVFVSLIGLTRLYLGVHFPSDILAGWSVSLAWVLGVALIVEVRHAPPALAEVRHALQKWRKNIKREFRVLRLVAADARTPRWSKILLSLAIGYTLMPFDLIPDFLPGIGHLDDAIIIPLLVVLALRRVPPEVLAECRQQATAEQEAAV